MIEGKMLRKYYMIYKYFFAEGDTMQVTAAA